MKTIGILTTCLMMLVTSSSTAQLQLQTFGNWDAFSIVTQGDDISTIADPGYETVATRGIYDGLGARLNGTSLSIWMNHEVSGGTAISRVDIDICNFRQTIQSVIDDGQTKLPSTLKTGMGYAYSTIFDGTYHAINNPNPVASGTVAVGNYGDANFERFCSGTSYLPNGFGPGGGFVDEIYITGEEVSGGKFFALDEATRTFWEIPDLGLGRWENGALVDTQNTTHIAMVLMSDQSSSPGEPIRLYVGEKNIDANGDGEVDFLERNGLRGGSVFFFAPDKGFSQTDLPDGSVTGNWSANINDALTETKLEDVHTNPFNGNELVFADQTDGTYRMDTALVFNGNTFNPAASQVSIDQIDDDDTGAINAPDNLVWSKDGLIYVQEDGSGDGIFQLNPDGTGVVQIAAAFSEPSGIMDFSDFVGYQPGSIFLVSVQGNGNSGAQLVALVSPTATSIAIDVELFDLVNGSLSSGGVSDLNDSDDSYLVAQPVVPKNASESPISLEVQATLPTDSPTHVAITLESRSNSIGLNQTIELFDYDLSAFEEVDSRDSLQSDSVTTIYISDNASRFVENGTGKVKARLAWRQNGLVLFYPWTIRIDQVVWSSCD